MGTQRAVLARFLFIHSAFQWPHEPPPELALGIRRTCLHSGTMGWLVSASSGPEAPPADAMESDSRRCAIILAQRLSKFACHEEMDLFLHTRVSRERRDIL